MELTRKTLEEKIEYLRSKLPQRPTAVEGPYFPPEHLTQEILKTNFSQISLQKVADHIGYFLGLLNSVKVTIGIETSEYMLAGTDKTDSARTVGLYKVIGGNKREIQLTKKFRFELKHIMAILAHESTHHYLYQHGIWLTDESENEVLTDIAAVYLGFGIQLFDGYQPITWDSDYWENPFGSGYTTHTIKIGYISTNAVKEVEILIRKIRVLESKKKKQIKKLLDGMLKEVDKLRLLFSDISSKIRNTPKSSKRLRISKDESERLVEIANAVYQGEVQQKIIKLSENIKLWLGSERMDNSEIEGQQLVITNLHKTILIWSKLVKKVVKT